MLPGLFAYAREVGAACVNLLRPKPPVNSSDWLPESSLTRDENRELHFILTRTASNGGVAITLDQSLSFLAWHRSPDELYYSGVWGCGAGRRFLTLDPEGIVYPCSHFRKQIGIDGEFLKAWMDSPILQRFRALEDNLSGKCGSCRMAAVCRGCRAVILELGGDFYDDDPHCPCGGFKENIPAKT